jgi:hypothetical protein
MLYYIILIILLLPNVLCYSNTNYNSTVNPTDNIIIDFNNCKVIIPSLSNGAIFTFLYYIVYYYIKKKNQQAQISQSDQLN